MEKISVEDAARSLVLLVDDVASNGTQVTITRAGEPAAVLLSVEEFRVDLRDAVLARVPGHPRKPGRGER